MLRRIARLLVLALSLGAAPVYGETASPSQEDPDRGRLHVHSDFLTQELRAYYLDEGTSLLAAVDLVAFQTLSIGFSFGFGLQYTELARSGGGFLLGAGVGAATSLVYVLASGGVTAAEAAFLSWVPLGGYALVALLVALVDPTWWLVPENSVTYLSFGLVGPLFTAVAVAAWHKGFRPATGQTQLVASMAMFGVFAGVAIAASHGAPRVTAGALLGMVLGGALGVPAALWIKPSRLHVMGISLAVAMGVMAGFLINVGTLADPARNPMLYWTAPAALGIVGLTLGVVVPKLPGADVKDAMVSIAPINGGAKVAMVGRF